MIYTKGVIVSADKPVATVNRQCDGLAVISSVYARSPPLRAIPQIFF
jgi:hypothetical protein